jgi:hypothetical protein
MAVEQSQQIRKDTIMVSRYYKAITAFVLSFASFLTADLANPEIAAALPDGVAKWLTLVGVPAVVSAGTWLVRNEPTVEEAEVAVARARTRV